MRFYVPFVAALLAMPAFAQTSTAQTSTAQTSTAQTSTAQTSGAPTSAMPDAGRPSTPPTGWVADAKTGCKVWDAAPEPDEKISWSGECANGMAEGTGTLAFSIGGKPAARYEGDMRNGRADGHGTYADLDGGRYEGQWRNNVADGFGVYTRDGKRLEGTWANGCLKQGADEAAVGVTRESCGFK